MASDPARTAGDGPVRHGRSPPSEWSIDAAAIGVRSRRLLGVAGWAFAAWVCDAAALTASFAALGHPLDVGPVGWLRAGQPAQRPPRAHPGWLGVLEATLAVAYAAFRVPAGVAVAAVLIYRWCPAAAGSGGHPLRHRHPPLAAPLPARARFPAGTTDPRTDGSMTGPEAACLCSWSRGLGRPLGRASPGEACTDPAGQDRPGDAHRKFGTPTAPSPIHSSGWAATMAPGSGRPTPEPASRRRRRLWAVRASAVRLHASR